MTRIGTLVIVVLGLSGCGAGPFPGDDEVGSDSETSTRGDSTSAEGGTSDTTDGDSETEADGETETDTGTSECPPREVVTARFRVMPSMPIQATCMIISEGYEPPNQYALVLDCEGTDITISVDSSITPQPSAYELIVLLDYRVDGTDRWVAVHRESAPDTLVLGGVAASVLDPPGTTLAEFFHDPALTLVEDQPCEPSMDMCGEFQRLGLAVSLSQFGPANDPVFDRGTWYADFLSHGYSIAVEKAERRLAPITCPEVTDEWYQLLAVWFPSD